MYNLGVHNRPLLDDLIALYESMTNDSFALRNNYAIDKLQDIIIEIEFELMQDENNQVHDDQASGLRALVRERGYR